MRRKQQCLTLYLEQIVASTFATARLNTALSTIYRRLESRVHENPVAAPALYDVRYIPSAPFALQSICTCYELYIRHRELDEVPAQFLARCHDYPCTGVRREKSKSTPGEGTTCTFR